MGAIRQRHQIVRFREVTGISHLAVSENLNLPVFSLAQRITQPINDHSKCGKSPRKFPTVLLAAIGLLLSPMSPAAGKLQLDVTADLPAKIVTSASGKSGVRSIVTAANNDQSKFLDDLFGGSGSADKKTESTKPSKPAKPTEPVEREPENPENNNPNNDASFGIEYSNLESLDLGFAIEGVSEAAFSVDIPNFWNRIDSGLNHQLIFASPDSDPDAQATLAITGELANGRTDQDAALAHATELANISGGEIIDSNNIETAAGPGWRVLLKVGSPSNVDMFLIDELVVIKKGSTLYQLELTAPEPIWHAAEEIMKRALKTIFIWK